MERIPIRQLARTCFMFGLLLGPSISSTNPVFGQDEAEPRVASRSPLQFGKNYWPNRPATTTKASPETQQPGIFRGGLVQQLRSITSSVLGDGEPEEMNTGEEMEGETGAPQVPSPPSLQDVIDAPAYTEDMESFEGDIIDNEIPDSPELEAPSGNQARPAPKTSTPVARPKMPEPAAPGQSRWRNQSQKPTPLNEVPSLNAGSESRTQGRNVPVPPRAPAASARSNTSSSLNGTGRRSVPTNAGNVPTPPATTTRPSAPATQPSAEAASKPNAMVAQPSKTNSSRRVNSSSEKLNTNEITLPTTQVTELDENRVKLSDRAPASSGSATSGPDAVPLVSKKLPPGRPKQNKELAIGSPTTVPSLPATTNSNNTAPTIGATETPKNTSLPVPAPETKDLTETKELAISGSEMKSEKTPATETPATASTTKSLDMEIPSVLVRLAGPADIPVGRKGDYELIAKNTGSIPLNGAIVRMDIPKGVTSEIDAAMKGQTESETLEDGSLAIVWQVSELAAGQSQKLPVKLTAAEAKNFAIAMEWTVMPQNGELLVNVQKPDLQIGLEGPAEVAFGVPQIYRLKISNPGTAPAENVVLNLSAEPYGSNSSPLGTIDPGTNRVVEVELTFQQKGKLKIKAEAVGDNLKAGSEVDVVVHQAMLEAKVQGVESEYVGAIVDYKLDLTNNGDTASENVIAQIELPDGVKVTQLPTGARLSGKNLLWDINSLNAGQTLTFTFQAELLSAGEKLFQATCRGSAGGSAVAQTKTTVDAVADLKLTLSDPPSPSPVGEEVLYELEITNRGKQSANKVKVLAQFSEGIEPSGAVGAEHKLVPGQVLFEPIPSIAAGETIKLQVRALASEAGVHRFRIEVQTDDEEIHHVLEESTRYMQTAARPTGTKLR